MYDEDALLPISALQHLMFCERRVALIHIEGLWADNQATAEGTFVHEHAHSLGTDSRGQVRIARALRVRSLSLGLTGQADIVEFHRIDDEQTHGGVVLDRIEGRWQLVPVEYKRGKQRSEKGYEIQVCAQALCLEEMLQTVIPHAALFYGASQRRTMLDLSPCLREETRVAALRLHEIFRKGTSPPPEHGPKCAACSLHDLCLPTLGHARSAGRYVADLMDSYQDDFA